MMQEWNDEMIRKSDDRTYVIRESPEKAPGKRSSCFVSPFPHI